MRICRWCGTRIRFFRRYCKTCRVRINSDAGIYLQSGSPPYTYMSRIPRAEDVS